MLRGVHGVHFVKEPVDEWHRAGLLQAMYAGELGKAVFQHTVLNTLATELAQVFLKHKCVRLIVSERSPGSNYHVFAKQHLQGAEMASYKMVYDRVMDLFPTRTSVNYIYLRTGAETAAERVRRRSRDGEDSVDIDYLKDIAARHEAWAADCPGLVSVVDADASETEVLERVLGEVVRLVGDYQLTNFAAGHALSEVNRRVSTCFWSAQFANVAKFMPGVFSDCHGSRVVCVALMQTRVHESATPRRVIKLVQDNGLKEAQLWTLFKSCGGRSKDDMAIAQQPIVEEHDQVDALRRVWRVLENPREINCS